MKADGVARGGGAAQPGDEFFRARAHAQLSKRIRFDVDQQALQPVGQSPRVIGRDQAVRIGMDQQYQQHVVGVGVPFADVFSLGAVFFIGVVPI